MKNEKIRGENRQEFSCNCCTPCSVLSSSRPKVLRQSPSTDLLQPGAGATGG